MRLRYEKAMSSRVFTDPMKQINEKYILVDMKTKEIENNILNKLKESKNKATNIITKLDTLSPLKTLARGYSITEYNGKILKSVKQIKTNDEIEIRLNDGNITAKALKILNN